MAKFKTERRGKQQKTYKCSRCGRDDLVEDDFWTNDKNKNGLQAHCKACHRIIVRWSKLRRRIREKIPPIPRPITPIRIIIPEDNQMKDVQWISITKKLKGLLEEKKIALTHRGKEHEDKVVRFRRVG